MNILITGASGHLGTAVIAHLLELMPTENIVGLVRNPQKGEPLQAQGLETRLGDYDDTDSLARAMQGIDKVLLISGGETENALQQHCNVVDAAQKAGVSGIAYTGRSLKDPQNLANRLMIRHFQTEAYIQASGLKYVLFRNALYLDVIPGFVGKQVFERGIQLPAGEGKVAFALRSEMGKAIARVLAQTDCDNRTYTFTGNEACSFKDVAAALSRLSERQVAYTPLESAEYTIRMKSLGLPEGLIQKLCGFLEDIQNSQEDTVSSDLAEVLGYTPTALEAGLKQLYAL
jgi:NAD(P)H dehydrogenase (quinone)